MNPGAFTLQFMSELHAQERRIRDERQAELHKKAVARRRKAKKGGRR